MNPETNKVAKSISMLDDNTLEVIFQDRVMLDLQAMQLVDQFCSELVGDLRVKRLIIAGRNTQISKEARVYGQLKSKELKNKVIAEAVVVNSLTQKMVANFYFAFVKDFYPAKFFTDIDKAKEWLSEF